MSEAKQSKLESGNPPSADAVPPKEPLKLRGFGFFNPSKKLIKLTFLDEKGEFQRTSYLIFVNEVDKLRTGNATKKDGTPKKSFSIYEDVPPWKK